MGSLEIIPIYKNKKESANACNIERMNDRSFCIEIRTQKKETIKKEKLQRRKRIKRYTTGK